MTSVLGTEVYLRHTQNTQHEVFRLSSNSLIVFKSELKPIDGKLCIEKDDHDYKVAKVALTFFQHGNCVTSDSSVLHCLEAGHRYKCTIIKEIAKKEIIKQLLGIVLPEELEQINKAALKFDMLSLRPFILCALMHMEEVIVENASIDSDLMDLAIELRDQLTNEEAERLITQTLINELSELILGVKNRFVSKGICHLSNELAKLLERSEEMLVLFNLFVDESSKSDLKSFEEKLTEALRLGEILSELQRESPNQNIAKLIECVGNISLYYESYKKDSGTVTDYLFGSKNYLETLGKYMGTSKVLCTQIRTEFPEVEMLQKAEMSLGNQMQKLERFNLDRSCHYSFILREGLEIRLVNGLNVLWIEPTLVTKIPLKLIKNVIHTLEVDRLMVGSKTYEGDPYLAYFKHIATPS